MPPVIALFSCTVFVYFLLRLDHKQSTDLSRTLWIPTVWLAYSSSKPLGVWFGSAGGEVGLDSPLDRNFLIILIIVSIVILVRRKVDLKRAIDNNPWLLVLVIYMLVSVLWSEFPFISFKRCVREIIAIIIGLVVSTEKDPRRAIETVIRRVVYVLIPFSVVLIKYYPQYGIMYTTWTGTRWWVGVANQKNGLGQLSSFAVFFLVLGLMSKRKPGKEQLPRYRTYLDMLVLLIALLLLKGPPGGFSATSIVMLVAAILFYFGLLWMVKHQKRMIKNLFAILVALVIVYGISTALTGKSLLDISSALGRDSTLTGRSEIWAALVPLAMQRPLIGHGFGGFWTPKILETYYFPAHNGYLEILLDLGFIGLIIIALFLISSGRKAQEAFMLEKEWGALWICWLLMTLINNITESSLNSFSGLLMGVPIWLAVTFGAWKSSRAVSGGSY